LKRLKITSAGENKEKRKLHTVDGNVN
jgi:hypothetical protein